MKTIVIVLLTMLCSCEPSRAKDYGEQWNKDSTNNSTYNPMYGY